MIFCRISNHAWELSNLACSEDMTRVTRTTAMSTQRRLEPLRCLGSCRFPWWKYEFGTWTYYEWKKSCTSWWVLVTMKHCKSCMELWKGVKRLNHQLVQDWNPADHGCAQIRRVYHHLCVESDSSCRVKKLSLRVWTIYTFKILLILMSKPSMISMGSSNDTSKPSNGINPNTLHRSFWEMYHECIMNLSGKGL